MLALTGTNEGRETLPCKPVSIHIRLLSTKLLQANTRDDKVKTTATAVRANIQSELAGLDRICRWMIESHDPWWGVARVQAGEAGRGRAGQPPG